MTPEKIIKEFNESHNYTEKDCLFIKEHKEDGLSKEQIVIVIKALNNICLQCFDDIHPCFCMRDD